MTCIVGVEHDGRVWIGGDAAASSGHNTSAGQGAKVWTRDGYALGFASSFRAGQLLRYTVNLPELPPKGTDLERFVVTDVVPAVRSCFIEHGVSPAGGDIPGWPLLIGVRGHLFHLDLDFAAHRARDGYMAIGCGSDLALGVMHSTRHTAAWPNVSPRRRLRLALAAAAHHSANVSKPFTVVHA